MKPSAPVSPSSRFPAFSRAAIFVGAALLLAAIAPICPAAEPSPPKKAGAEKAPASESRAALEAAGLKLSGSSAVLADEARLSKLLRDAMKQKTVLVEAERETQRGETEIETIKNQITELKIKHVELSATLTNVSSAVENNQVVGELNAARGQIDLLIEKQKEASDELKKARANASELRETFIENVLTMRNLADSAAQKWEKLAADPVLQKAVATENAAAGLKLKLAPGAGFASNEKRLKALEHTVLSEAIPLANDEGSLWVDVTIDGKHRKKMVVDSGATLVSLPYAMAKDLGIEPTSQNQKVVVGLADGSEAPATLMSIPSIRVGKFIVEDVDCVVLDERAVKAPALLGMSFLGKFKFEVDKEKSELRMVKFDSGEAKSKASPGAASKKKK